MDTEDTATGRKDDFPGYHTTAVTTAEEDTG